MKRLVGGNLVLLLKSAKLSKSHNLEQHFLPLTKPSRVSLFSCSFSASSSRSRATLLGVATSVGTRLTRHTQAGPGLRTESVWGFIPALGRQGAEGTGTPESALQGAKILLGITKEIAPLPYFSICNSSCPYSKCAFRNCVLGIN